MSYLSICITFQLQSLRLQTTSTGPSQKSTNLKVKICSVILNQSIMKENFSLKNIYKCQILKIKSLILVITYEN